MSGVYNTAEVSVIQETLGKTEIKRETNYHFKHFRYSKRCTLRKKYLHYRQGPVKKCMIKGLF